MYKIRNNAVDIYIAFCKENEINLKQTVYSFLEANKWQRIFVHSSWNIVEVSQYEKTVKVPVPFDCIEQIEDEVIEWYIDDWRNRRLFWKIIIWWIVLILLLNILFYINLPERSIEARLKDINNKIYKEDQILDQEIVKLNWLLDNKWVLDKQIKDSKIVLIKQKKKIEDLRKQKFIYSKK